MKKSKTISWIIALVVVLAIAASIALWSKQQSNYIYVSPKKGDIVEAIYGLGKVKSHREYEVKVGVVTTVEKVWVKTGQFVKKGDLLIQFKDTGAFHAPFDGTVTSVVFQEPETVFPQVTVLKMQDLEDIYLEVSLEQEGALRVQKGQQAIVLFESIRGEKYRSEVESIFPDNDEFIAHISVEGLDSNVLPGMTADVSITVGERKNALLIPVSSLSNGQVIIKRDGEKQKVKVNVGSIDGEWAEIVGDAITMADEILIRKEQRE